MFKHPYLNKYIFISFDVDWASEEMLEFVIGILKKYNVGATFFATHDSDILKSLDSHNFEIGLHPSYMNTREIDNQITDLKQIYPNAIGERSHGLYFGSTFVKSWLKHDIKYDSNISLPFQSYILPHMHCSGLYRIPYFWDDSVHVSYGYDFNWNRIKWDLPGLKIFSFHPVHIFYNTDTPEFYQNIKAENYPDRSTIVLPEKGTCDMFTSLLDYIKTNNFDTGLIIDIYNNRKDFSF